MSAAIPRQTAVWDERRNSSRALAVPPSALPEALSALDAFRRAQPALYAWIPEGAPRLSDGDHLRRFGEPYRDASESRTAPRALVALLS